MKGFAAVLGAAALWAGEAQADVLNVYNQSGETKAVDTSTLQGCVLVFDSKGAQFLVC